MFLSTKPVLKNGTLSINGKDALTGVPDNVVVTPLTNSSAFVGATSADANSRLVFKLGVIEYACSFSFLSFFFAFVLNGLILCLLFAQYDNNSLNASE